MARPRELTVEALRRGDPQVLAAMLEQHGTEIQGVPYLILRNAADAEDVLMDTSSPPSTEVRQWRAGGSTTTPPARPSLASSQGRVT